MKRFCYWFVAWASIAAQAGERPTPSAAAESAAAESAAAESAAQGAAFDYAAQIQPLLSKYCAGCHNPNDKDGGLVLVQYATLLAGGEHGAAIAPGRSGDSRLIRVLTGAAEPAMPPEDNPRPTSEEIALLAAWIDAGAKGPDGAEPDPTALVVPKIVPATAPVDGIGALAFAPQGQLLAVARYAQVELVSVADRSVVRRLTGHRGRVNAVIFSADGTRLVAAGGEPGLVGEVKIWNVADGALLDSIVGHQDSLYAVALSPDGATLATGGYDQQIKLWEAATGKELRTLAGHNDCIYELSFRAGGNVLASASGDRTAKLWDVATGERLDTFSQPTKELLAIAFRPDGQRVAAGGGDSRIRIWQISPDAKENSNPLLISRVGHEGAIVKLAYTRDGRFLVTAAEDRTIKLWDADAVRELRSLGPQPDSVQALAISPDDRLLAAGRLDGTLAIYQMESGALLPPPPPAKPELAMIAPRGVQRGAAARLKLSGKHLSAAKLHASHGGLRAAPVPSAAADSLEIDLHVAADLPAGRYELWLSNEGGESARLPVFVDDLPQVLESQLESANSAKRMPLPVDVWGALAIRGDRDTYSFQAEAGQTLVFDIAAQSLGAKGDLVLTLLDEAGRVLAANNDFDGGPDPLLSYTFARSGQYAIRVNDLRIDGSGEHFYRLAAGQLAVATGAYPLSLPANQAGEVSLVGVNLGAGVRVAIPAAPVGEIDLPQQADGPRRRRSIKLTIGSLAETLEVEPNEQPAAATPLATPVVANGRIAAPGDTDLYRFESRRGQTWILETEAQRRGSPLDTVIDMLHADGRPVERLLLQATRDSYLTFRGTDASGREFRLFNWEEMNLNEYLYVGGELVKLFRAPQGPDSGFLTYEGDGGRRRTEFDTTATAHALDEPAYIVAPVAPEAKIIANGLPVFPLFYANDDDAERRRGTDSRLTFVAPADGSYLVRVRDSRSAGDSRHAYRLIVREAQPDFHVALHGAGPAVGRGSGKTFSVTVDRLDGFDGEVTVEVGGTLPPGVTVTSPLTIEAGHREARGLVFAADDAPEPTQQNASQTVVKATAVIDGRSVTKEAPPLGRISLTPRPKLLVHLEPVASSDALAQTAGAARAGGAEPAGANAAPVPSGTDLANPGGARSAVTSGASAASVSEIVLAPGRRVPAMLKIERQGFDALVNLDVLNLPHGVIVDDIGLNAVQILEGQTERQIFLYCAPWVGEMTRDVFALARVEGDQASSPVRLVIRAPASQR